MIINHNMASLNTYRQLSANNANSAKSLEKLSSGLRINRAGDDAAGLAISEKMRGQIRGLDQASRNAQDGISMIQTAEGGLSETHSILQRMRELAVQAGNDTNAANDRDEIQKEMNQLTSEINRIGNTTEFNTQKLLKGNSTAATGVVGDVTLGTPYAAASGVVYASATGSGAVDLTSGSALNVSGASVVITVGSGTYTLDDADLSGFDPTSNAEIISKLASASDGSGGTLADVADVTVDASGKIVITAKTAATGTDVSVAVTVGSGDDPDSIFGFGTEVEVSGATGTPATPADFDFTITTNLAVGDTITFDGTTLTAVSGSAGSGEFVLGATASGTATAIATKLSAGTTNYNVSATGATITLAQKVASDPGASVPTVTLAGPGGPNFTSNLQIGANTGQSFTISIEDMRADALDISSTTASDTKTVTVDGKTYTARYTSTNDVTNGTDSTGAEYALDVSDHDNATAAVKVLDEAITKVSAERSKIGAYQNRLDHTISNLGTSSENLTAAESRVRDVDMAKEMMNFQKNNILSQAAQAMLAQANQQPQGVLQLLR